MTDLADAPVLSNHEPVSWRRDVAPYAHADVGRSVLDLFTSVVPYLALSVVMVLLLRAGVTYWAVLALSVLAAGFLLRTFIVFHDCTHGSFWPTKRGNAIIGSVTGMLVYSPFAAWRHEHAIHHATAGDLDRRGAGDVDTATLEEYYAMSRGGRLGYRLFRNPVVMFGLGWIWAMLISTRIPSKKMRPRMKRSVWLMNLSLAVSIGTICLLIGWQDFLLIQAPVLFLAGSTGVFMFYVQHQFEDVYWETNDNWDYKDAALRGSSYLRLPKVLQYFTGNIGLHHVHHLSARIPNYNLQRAHDELELFREVPTLTLRDGVKCARLKVVDAQERRLLTWAEAKRVHAQRQH